jgi:hypothetical protein
MSDTGKRSNYFHNIGGENNNVGEVIYKTKVPQSSAGFRARSGDNFFELLGHDRNKLGSPERNAEQEYLLQGMPKGPMRDAATIANYFQVGISVRPTGVLAHMGIESGDPTKAQEFKNKTSKELDLFLCDEIDWQHIGSVVHYDPRVGWSSAKRKNKLFAYYAHKRKAQAPSSSEWAAKRKYIQDVRMKQLEKMNLRQRLRFWPANEGDWKKLKDLFDARAKEFDEEDYEYRFGHYKLHAHLEGPYIQLAARKGVNMVGDHDLFGFTRADGYGILVHDSTPYLETVQLALQNSPSFQAQHGGIWNWTPSNPFNVGIKNKIMSAHSSPHGEPLIFIQPGYKVHAAFYVPGREVLVSAWDFPQAHAWLMSTYSGRQLEQDEIDTGEAISRMFS